MLFKSFRLQVLIRLLVMSGFLGTFFYYIFASPHYLRSGYFFTFFVLSLVELFWYINRTNRDLTTFFQSIIQHDFTTTFTRRKQGKSFDALYQSMNDIITQFRLIGAEKEAQFLFMEMLIEHVRVAIVAFDSKGHIQMINASFKNLLGLNYIRSVEGMEQSYPELADLIRNMDPEKPVTYRLNRNDQLLHLSILANHFKMGEEHIKLVSMQNIKSELEAGEVDAWQKLIRVLTHEIMNSVTPITSLTDTLLDIVQSKHGKGLTLSEKELDNLQKGLQAIKERNAGLNTFTKAYQSLTRIPTPNFEVVEASQLAESMNVLLLKDLKDKGINFTIDLSDDLQFTADRSQLTQVIINLVKNASEALENSEQKEIHVRMIGSPQATIEISDTGPGIPEEYQDKIFIPFFTTKKKGSGIGLALARQIIHLHNGTLTMESSDLGTTFTIRL